MLFRNFSVELTGFLFCAFSLEPSESLIFGSSAISGCENSVLTNNVPGNLGGIDILLEIGGIYVIFPEMGLALQ